MTVTQLSNIFNALVQMHQQQVFSYPSLQYYKTSNRAEGANVNRQNNFDPVGSKGTQYPFLFAPYPDAKINYAREGSRAEYNVDLYLVDLQFYANNGTKDNRTVLEIQRDLMYIATDILQGLNEVAQLQNDFEINSANIQAVEAEFLEHQNNNRECILRLNLVIESALECSSFVFNPALLPVETPYPVENRDYENINS